MDTNNLKKLCQDIFKRPTHLGDDPTPYAIMKHLALMIGLVCHNADDGFACVISVAETTESGELNAFLQMDGKIINQAVLLEAMADHLSLKNEQYEVEEAK